MRPRLLDLFCGAGGCSVGYARAGFEVVGVDIASQPNYPFRFFRADALGVLADWDWWNGQLGPFAGVAASPPCQAYSAMTNCRPGLADEYAKLIDETRELLRATGLPYIIENVPGAPLASSDDLFGAHGVTLCGRMFGLDLYRHRLFETSFPLAQPAHPKHMFPASKAGHWEPGTIISVSGHVNNLAEARRAMGIDWMSRDELSEAIPPAYTEWLGTALLSSLHHSDPQREGT